MVGSCSILLRKLLEIISKLDPETFIAIEKAQNIMKNDTLKNNLI